MCKRNHSPGPWQTTLSAHEENPHAGENVVVVCPAEENGDFAAIALVKKKSVVHRPAGERGRQEHELPYKANTHLIAAAPDLLHVCEEVVRVINESNFRPDIQDLDHLESICDFAVRRATEGGDLSFV